MINRTIGEIISEHRKKEGLTQEELGIKLNVSRSLVSKWEKGERYPDITLINALCSVLKFDANILFSCIDFSGDYKKNYDYAFINGFKKKITFCSLILFTPLLSFLGTFARSSLLFFIFLGISLVLILGSFYILISSSFSYYSLINKSYNMPKYTLSFKNSLTTYLVVLCTLLFVLFGLFKNIIYPICLEIIFLIVITLLLYKLPIQISKKTLIPFSLVSILFFVLGFILVFIYEYLPYYLFFYLSCLSNLICLYFQSKYIV